MNQISYNCIELLATFYLNKRTTTIPLFSGDHFVR